MGKTEDAAEFVLGNPFGEGGPVVRNCLHQFVEPRCAHMIRQPRVGCRGGDGDTVKNLLANSLGCPVVEGVELRGNARFERKPLQDGGGEGVDGLNPQAAGGLERPRKEGSRLPEAFTVERIRILAKPEEFLPEMVIRKHRPASEALDQPVLHVGCRGHREGQAKNSLRGRSGQQQARDPVREDLGFSRSGVRRYPGGGAGVGGLDLRPRCLVESRRTAHCSVPTFRPEVSSHSPKRARW